jgi:Flp pilus assembly protein TadG
MIVNEKKIAILGNARGAILVEAALVLIFVLGLFFASFQIGVIGYYQLALDQSAQTQAHMIALGETASVTNADLTKYLPNMSSVHVNLGAPAVLPSFVPVNDMNVNYNFNSPQARTGGYTTIQPFRQASVLSTNSGVINLLFVSLTLNAPAIEATESQFCPHFCLKPGGPSKATIAKDRIDYFTNGDNTTPYYMGFHYMVTCATNQNPPTPWDLTESTELIPGHSTSWSVCFNAGAGILSPSLTWRALGTAEHLDSTNNGYEQPGEFLDPSYWRSLPAITAAPPATGFFPNGTLDTSKNPPSVPPAMDKAGPFFEVWCHRNYYKWLDVYGLSQVKAPDRQAAQYNSQDYLTRAYGFFQNEAGASHNGAPRAGQSIYGSNPMGTAGWDATNTSAAGGGSISYQPLLTPWWGCGVPL